MVPQFASLVYEVAVEDGTRNAANDPSIFYFNMLFSLALSHSEHCQTSCWYMYVHVFCLPGDHCLEADSHGPVLGVHAAECGGHVGHHQDEGEEHAAGYHSYRLQAVSGN